MILDAAQAIIEEQGLAGLSAREIARRISYSPGTIYNMFENLDDVILRVEGRMLDDLGERLKGVATDVGDPVEATARMAHAYLAFTHERPKLWNLLFEHHMPATSVLPDWYAGQIRYLAQPHYKVTWLGLYLASNEPAAVIDRKELSTWLHAPITRTPGFFFEQTAYDPSTAPSGTYLYVMGAVIPGAKGTDQRYLLDMFEKFEQEIGIMYPALAKPVWRRRHLVHNPSFGVIQKPGLVGAYRPHWRAPNVEGLWFASETFRSRGIGVDRASRAGLTVVEDMLGTRLPGFEDTWRY